MTENDNPEPARSRLTQQQSRVLAAIRCAIQQQGYPPTVREIAAAVGLGSPSSVTHHLRTLEDLGIIRRDRRNPRAIEVHAGENLEHVSQRDGRDTVDVPVLGSIAAGAPILAEQHVEQELTLPTAIVGHGRVFALWVKGDSMIEAAICDGDLVVIRQQPTADNGDFVAAMIGDEATVKEFRKENGKVQLLPHNPRYSPISADRAVILGKVVSIARRL